MYVHAGACVLLHTHPLRKNRRRLDIEAKGCNLYYVARRKTMTELLRQALSEAESLSAVERATGVKRQSMMRFLRGEQSLRLDMADRLAAYLGIDVRRRSRP